MKKRFYLYFLIFILSVISVNAESSINIYREDYFPGETFQADIVLDFIPEKSITLTDFSLLYENESISFTPFYRKIDDRNYFIYFNLPDSLKKGEYKFVIKNLLKIEEGVLKEIPLSKEFKINTINPGFSYLIENQLEDGSFNHEIADTSIAAIVLKNAGLSDKADLALNSILKRKDITGCFPSGVCNVKDTAFALLALNTFGKDLIKTKNWLMDASNNFNLGTWKIKVKGEDGICILNGNSIEIKNGEYLIDINNPEIRLNCTELNNTVKVSFIHSYLGNIYGNLFSDEGKELNISIDASGCYGITYKSKCNYQISAYTEWVLSKVTQSTGSNYIKSNLSETSTLDHALLYLITRDQNALDWLLNNKQDNAWGKSSASISKGLNDVYTSSFVVLALKDNQNISDTEIWLDEQPNTNVLYTAIKLYSYLDEEIKPIVSISPGFIDKELISLDLENKNNYPVNVTIPEIKGISLDKNNFILENKSSIIITSKLNEIIDNKLRINYGNKFYDIPILTTISKDTNVVEDYIELVGIASKIKQEFNIKDSEEKEIKIKNLLNKTLLNIRFEITGDLDSVIKLEKIVFNSLDPYGELQQKLYINEEKNAELKNYSGSLVIKSEGGVLKKIPIELEFISGEVINKEEENKSITPEKETQKEGSSLKWLFSFIIIIIIGVGILWWLKRPKKQTFEEYVKERGV